MIEQERAVMMTMSGCLGLVFHLPNGVDAKAVRIENGVVFGQAMWPGHPDPIKWALVVCL